MTPKPKIPPIDPTEGTLLCPNCGHNFSHISKVFTRLGSDPLEASVYEGTAVNGSTRSRRSALVIEIDGECGHSWRWIVQQHKGQNFLELEPIGAREGTTERLRQCRNMLSQMLHLVCSRGEYQDIIEPLDAAFIQIGLAIKACESLPPR